MAALAAIVMSAVDTRLSQTLDTHVTVTLFVTALVYYLYRSAAKIPHDAKRVDPAHQWLLGSLKATTANLHRFWDRHFDVHQQMGEQSWFTAMPALISPSTLELILGSDPALTEYVLKTNHKNYVKGQVFNQQNRILLGDGIFVVDGKGE